METIPSKLEEKLKSLMLIIWDFNRIVKTLKELNYDTEKNPLGRLGYE
jgi:poly [ADP-ribose] polymerase